MTSGACRAVSFSVNDINKFTHKSVFLCQITKIEKNADYLLLKLDFNNKM